MRARRCDQENRQGHIDDLHTMRCYLREPMGSLARCGVMFVAAAGSQGAHVLVYSTRQLLLTMV